VKSKYYSSKSISNNIFEKKTNGNQILINISGFESPDKRSEYNIDNVEIKSRKSSFYVKPDRIYFQDDKIKTKYLSESENNDCDYIPKKDDSKRLMKEYLQMYVGIDLYNNITQMIELEEYPSRFITSQTLKTITGTKYPRVAKILTNCYVSCNSQQFDDDHFIKERNFSVVR